jgi:hypothetical protein
MPPQKRCKGHSSYIAVLTGQPVVFVTSLTLWFKSGSSSLKLPVSSYYSFRLATDASSEANIYEDNASSNNKNKCLIVIFFVSCFHSCHFIIEKDIVSASATSGMQT